MKNDDLGKLILRLCVGGLMLFHGVHKLIYGHGFIASKLKAVGLPQFLIAGVPLGEVVAPLLIIFGLYTRPAALLLAFVMGMAVWLVHMGQLTALGPHGGYALELQAFYFFGALAVAFFGAGRYGVAKPGKWN
ncbi:MAG: DoxX family protein [Chlorobiaceae bacterium]|nr:DoxX family protein [Chlorobiaceae bacterium]